ncbi:hypothetical protein MN608_01952 [Microdochium nivale]|nr:hypothetical protein MN608_01952 [Microdochium nivale]
MLANPSRPGALLHIQCRNLTGAPAGHCDDLAGGSQKGFTLREANSTPAALVLPAAYLVADLLSAVESIYSNQSACPSNTTHPRTFSTLEPIPARLSHRTLQEPLFYSIFRAPPRSQENASDLAHD